MGNRQVRADSLSSAIQGYGQGGLDSGSALMVMRNQMTGQGTDRDPLMYLNLSAPTLLTQEHCEALYMHWLVRRVVDEVPDEITSAGWLVQMGLNATAKEIPGIAKALRDLKAHVRMNESLKSARQFGGSAMLMYLSDGREPKQPVDWKNLTSLDRLVPVDRWYIGPAINTPNALLSDPEVYRIYPHGGMRVPGGLEVHRDRVLRFEGRRLSHRIREQNQGWGMSEIQLIVEALARYTGGLGDLGQMLRDLDIFTHKIKGLATMLAAGKEDQVRQRMRVNSTSRSAYGGYVIDADKEDIGFASRNASGLSSIMELIKADLVGATGFPATRLFGESPQGMGSTGRGEERDFSRTVTDYRDSVVTEPLEKLVYTLMKCKSGPTRGRVPKDWKTAFPSLFMMNERETADTRARVAAVDWRYFLMGALSPEEISMSRFGGAEYSSETTLDMNLRTPAGALLDKHIAGNLRIQGKQDPLVTQRQAEEAAKAAMVAGQEGAKGVRGLSATGERSDPTDNENGSMNMDGKKSVASDEGDDLT